MWHTILYIAYLVLMLLLPQTNLSTQVVLDLLHLNNAFEQLMSNSGPESFPDSLNQWNIRYGVNGSQLGDPAKTALTREQFIHSINAVRDVQYADIVKHVINEEYQTEESRDALGKRADFLYAKKLIIPLGSTIYCWGDIHGDIVALLSVMTYLKSEGVIDDNFNIIKPNTYIISCGDFVDRGLFGVEVLYVLCTLKQRNSRHVLLLRGNHEELIINVQHGFTKELNKKFDNTFEYDNIKVFQPFYASLPCVLYLGGGDRAPALSYVQFCHGGLEFYDMRTLLINTQDNAVEIIGKINRKTIGTKLIPRIFESFIDALPYFLLEDNRTPSADDIGFMWSDFKAGGEGRFQTNTSGRGDGMLIFGNLLTQALLNFSGGSTPITAVIRGHQHGKSMPKLYSEKENHNIYKLVQDNDQNLTATIITNVLSVQYGGAQYMLGRGFMKIEVKTSDTTQWLLTSIWQPLDTQTAGIWHVSQPATLTNWKNAVD